MNTKEIKNWMAIIFRFFLPFFLFISLLYLFTNLLEESRIGEWAYVALVSISSLIGFIIFFNNDIKEVDFRNMKLILSEAKKTKQKIDKTVFALVKLIASLSSFSMGSWRNKKRLNDGIEKVLKDMGIESSKINEILEGPRAVEKMMKSDVDSLTSREKKKVEEELN